VKPASLSSLQLLREVAETIASRYLNQYTADLSAEKTGRRKSKEINDALWGTVSLDEIEVAVLDSPLLQRLRFLRMMGAAHWVYPGAVHTRFEHAIGALHLTQQLIDSLNAQADNQGGKPLITEQDAQLLKLSSLFSHVGYLAFSDGLVPELLTLPSLSTVATEFATASESAPNEFGADPTFCQLLAYYIVKSAAVKALLLTLVKKRWLLNAQGSEEEAVEYATHRIALTLIGRRIEEAQPQLQELVNGPFDSSTLDALVRDAKFSGIPSVLDIRRLIQKLAVEPFHLQHLPDWINGSLVFDEDERKKSPRIWIFGMQPSSTSILNELQLAQLLVNTKIRRHPKVLATEQMLRSVVRTLANLTSVKDLLLLLYSTPEDALVSMTAGSVESALGHDSSKPLNDDDRDSLTLAAETLAAIRERRIWVRALQLSDAVVEADALGAVGINRFYGELRHVQRGPLLVSAICDEVAKVRKASDQTEIPRAALAAQINLHSLPSFSAESRVGRAVVLPFSKLPYMLRETWDGGDNWVDQYLRGQPTLYVFAPPELADAVYVAIERLVDRLFNSALPSGTLAASKRDKKAIKDLKLQTAKPGFWHGHSWGIRPRTAVWSTARIDERIHDVAFKLNKVETISLEGGKPDLRDATYRWLEQFETTNDIECALTMLECFEIVNRQKTTAAFTALFKAYPAYENAYAVSFGEPKDGGVIQGYFADEQAKVVKVVTLDQWVSEPEDRPLIFVDDCCGSGSQVCDILAAWLEREDLREDLGEERGALSKEIQARLLRTEIAFLFITAWDIGVNKIRNRLPKLGLSAIVFPYLSDNDIPFVKEALLKKGKKQADVDAFITRCAAIGAEILESNQVLPEKVEKRKFGYGNRGMLLATLVNVPTQTTTLIWESGKVDGVRWEALLPRRKKE
jgi:HD superfamily phosphohydrolase